MCRGVRVCCAVCILVCVVLSCAYFTECVVLCHLLCCCVYFSECVGLSCAMRVYVFRCWCVLVRLVTGMHVLVRLVAGMYVLVHLFFWCVHMNLAFGVCT